MKESEELIVDDSSGHSNILKVKMNCKSEKIVVARLLQVWRPKTFLLGLSIP